MDSVLDFFWKTFLSAALLCATLVVTAAAVGVVRVVAGVCL